MSALTREDIYAALQFAVISLVILPVLPKESNLPPPFDVLSPFRIWLMVVFISGINFLGYLAIKLVGVERGIGITGLLYALILVVARSAQLYFGDTGVYISSLLSGLADVDAITISLAQLSDAGTVSMTVAAQSIVIAVIANTIAKGAIVIIGGASPLKRALLPGMLLVLVTAVVVTFIVI